jgi:homopolymeric O-antigen transport system ATP-binding protein
MNSNTIAINVDNISKCYRLGVKDEMSETFGATVINFLKSPLKNYRKYRSLYKFDDVDPDNEHEFSDILWALKNVSFDVKRGESVGIIGRNGSGKSTLLKVIAKITTPTKGYAQVNGRISSLLEVGTGFHPELTGKENIYLNGTILGMRKKEIDEKLEEIIAFSGVEKFIETPVKRYSSGMRVRLAFSVAAHLEPEILLIDEVLAVGDAEFQKKCLGKMGEVTRQGRTVLFVSHQMAAVEQLCHRVIWLNQGSVVSSGPSTEIISKYLNDGHSDKIGPGGDLSMWPRELPLEPIFMRGRMNEIPFQKYHFVKPLKPLRIELELEIPRPLNRFSVGINFKNFMGECVYAVNTRWFKGKLHLEKKGSYKVVCEIDQLPLVPKMYQLWMTVRVDDMIIDRIEKVVTIEVMRDNVYGTGELPGSKQGYFLSQAQWNVNKL